MSDSRPNVDVIVYSTPFCGYCAAARRLLTDQRVAFEEIDVSFDPSRRQEMIERSGRNTVPQIFVRGSPVGGYDELRALVARGELDALLQVAASDNNHDTAR